MTFFILWRRLHRKRQLDIEIDTCIKRWRISEFEAGRLDLTINELNVLAKLTGLSVAQLSQPVELKQLKRTKKGEKK